ncbi:hypothetical protein RchiOBHm_Chr4g0402531 [Rosa chinensis]|uniref:Uncharacterized protein n=1 Tax=Rosa chinensis TaxID=74649 RepID=A0A2P6QTB6_ROSCH|nr:hypothetical protein RchiOBHm_Chr4g0402531 [Rosa chinensis]
MATILGIVTTGIRARNWACFRCVWRGTVVGSPVLVTSHIRLTLTVALATHFLLHFHSNRVTHHRHHHLPKQSLMGMFSLINFPVFLILMHSSALLLNCNLFILLLNSRSPPLLKVHQSLILTQIHGYIPRFHKAIPVTLILSSSPPNP